MWILNTFFIVILKYSFYLKNKWTTSILVVFLFLINLNEQVNIIIK